MSEWEEKLNTLLSDPDAMAQVMNMAQNLSQQMGQSGRQRAASPPAGGAASSRRRLRPPPPPQGDPMGDLSSLPGGIDPSASIAKLLPAALAAQPTRERRDRRIFARAAPVFEAGAAGQGRARGTARALHPPGEDAAAQRRGAAQCITAICATTTASTPACRCRTRRAANRRVITDRLPRRPPVETHRRQGRRRGTLALRRRSVRRRRSFSRASSTNYRSRAWTRRIILLLLILFFLFRGKGGRRAV